MSAIIGFINLNAENVNEAIGNEMVEKLNIYKLDSIKGRYDITRTRSASLCHYR